MSSPPSEIKVQHVGDTVKLNCSAGGSPLPRVAWFKNGRRVFSRAANDGNGLIKSEMVIHRFKPGDSGIYTCLFYNDKNMTAESNTSLSMLDFICYNYLTQCLYRLIVQTHSRYSAIYQKMLIANASILFQSWQLVLSMIFIEEVL